MTTTGQDEECYDAGIDRRAPVRVEEQLKNVVASLATLTQQGQDAAESRKRGYEAQEATRLEIVGINGGNQADDGRT